MIKVAIPIVDEDEIGLVSEVLKSGHYTSGPRVQFFEEKFAEYVGTKYAVACNSGTAALHMVYQAIQLNNKNTFITSPMSFFSTISAGLMHGSFPTFVDVDVRCNLHPDWIEDAITEDTAAIVPVHFYGHPCEIEKIVEIGKRYGIPVIEDCAQAHGAEYNHKRVGSFGLAGCFSFFATKNMTTIEGGMITTDDEALYEYCKCIRSHGMTDRNTHTRLGYNYRMSEINAAVGQIQIQKLDEMNDKRIANSLYLQRNIKNEFIKIYGSAKNVKDVYFWQPVYTPKPHDFMEHLEKNEIGFRHRYWEPLYRQPIFKNMYADLNLKNSETLSGRVFGLPNHPALEKEELERVVEVINGFEPTKGSID